MNRTPELLDPYIILGLDPSEATDETVRQAYLRKLKEYPPDRDARLFQRIHQAYQILQTRKNRRNLKLFGLPPSAHLIDYLPEDEPRPRATAERWIAMISTESARMGEKKPSGKRKEK